MPQLTEEDIKNMSPEELAELQKQNCIFCHIASGKVPSKKVYEDDICFAILDINPATKGHMLLMTKEHYMMLPQTPENVVKHLGKIAKSLSLAALRSFAAQGTNIFIANGQIAGQRAPHLIVHIIPRMEGDGVTCFELPERSISESDMMQLHRLLAQRLGMRTEMPKKAQEEAKPKSLKEESKPNQEKVPNKKLEEIDLDELKELLK